MKQAFPSKYTEGALQMGTSLHVEWRYILFWLPWDQVFLNLCGHRCYVRGEVLRQRVQLQANETFWSLFCILLTWKVRRIGYRYWIAHNSQSDEAISKVSRSQHWWGYILLLCILYTKVRDCYRSHRIILVMGLSTNLPPRINMRQLKLKWLTMEVIW